MTADRNKSIKSILYNHLNLPTRVTFNTGSRIDYTYDATGVKQSKQVTASGVSSFTYYAGNYIYEQNTTGQKLAFFSHPEGYVEKNGNVFNYIYQYKDHLGNVRLSYADSDNNGSIDANTEIISEKNYYPFGLTHKGYNNIISGNSNAAADKFGYNGKELNDELGLDWLDYGSRNYDASLGRWMNIDPKADLLEMSSPYVYALNSPLVYIDEDGELPILINGKTTSDSKRADESYWTTEILNTIKNSGIANPGGGVHYVDGNRGHKYSKATKWGDATFANVRSKAGSYAVSEDWSSILSQLERDPETGKITEKIQIYTHSRGAAFGVGYTEKLLELIKKNSDQFADPSNVVDFVYNMAPHQSDFLTGPKGVDSYSMDHDGDMLSDNDMDGVQAAFTTDEKSKGAFGAHSITSFNKNLKAFTSAILQGGASQDVINNFVKTMKEDYDIDVNVKQ